MVLSADHHLEGSDLREVIYSFTLWAPARIVQLYGRD